MKRNVEGDPASGACTTPHDSVHLQLSADVEGWRDRVTRQLPATLGTRRRYLLVDDGGFTVNPRLADAYGKVAEEVRTRFAKDVFRYGASDRLSAASARLQSRKRARSSNRFTTRREALAAPERPRAPRVERKRAPVTRARRVPWWASRFRRAAIAGARGPWSVDHR
jgi:hypothetical protein